MAYCTKCGTQLGHDMQFCSHCGHAVNTAKKSRNERQQPSKELQQKKEARKPVSNFVTTLWNRKKLLLIGGISAIVVIALIAVLIAVLNSGLSGSYYSENRNTRYVFSDNRYIFQAPGGPYNLSWTKPRYLESGTYFVSDDKIVFRISTGSTNEQYFSRSGKTIIIGDKQYEYSKR